MTKTVSFKLDRSLLIRIDGLAANRSDFVREAVEEKLRRGRGKRKSVWDALCGSAGLNAEIPRGAGKVKRIDL
jgi:Arc/MetJ-type ribon-helix-helix transcriptional regulator